MLNYIKAERTSPAEFDQALVWTALILMLLGIVMVYSASIATAEASRFTGNQPTYFLVRQALFLGRWPDRCADGISGAGEHSGKACRHGCLCAASWRWCWC